MTPDRVTVWLVPVAVPAAARPALAVLLDDAERDRAAALHEPADRHRYLAAHAAARLIVADRLGTAPAALRWRYGPQGKPELAEPRTGLRVNLSHCGGYAVVALCDGRDVGVDLHRVTAVPDVTRLAARFFPAAEARHVAAGPDPGTRADRYAELWVRKEAAVKAAGGRLAQGLRVPVRGAAVVAVPGADGSAARPYRLAGVPAPDGYRAAVALAGDPEFTVDPRRWSWPAPVPVVAAPAARCTTAGHG